MRRLGRSLVTLAILVGMLLAGARAAALLGPVLDTVRGFVTQLQLARIRDRLVAEGEGFGGLPEPGDDEALADRIRALWGYEEDPDLPPEARHGKDPALDPWGHPYHLDEGDEAGWYVLVSNGPNGEVDDCAGADLDPGAAGDEGANAVQPDDICLWFHLSEGPAGAFAPLP